MLIELLGYLGMILVLASFLMASVVKLRVVNAIGSTISGIYALLISSYPIALMNICLVAINLYYLWKLRNKEPNYRIISLDPNDGLIRFFLDNYKHDISECFPNRSWDINKLNRAYIVCHGTEPAGILMGTESEGALQIALDYTNPAYRDCSVAKYLLKHLPENGIHRLSYKNAEQKHIPFLKKMGYEEKSGSFERSL